MSPAQREALERAVAADGPIKLPAAPARILCDRFRYLQPADGGLWEATDAGRSVLEDEQRTVRQREVERALTSAARAWAARVRHWLEAHETLDEMGGSSYLVLQHAWHVAACDHDGVEPIPDAGVGNWGPEWQAWLLEKTRMASRCLRDYDLALDRGVSVTATYAPDAKVPRSRQQAATAATEQEGGVVHLRVYRERRPNTDGPQGRGA